MEAVIEGIGAVPMKVKNALLALATCLIAAGPLAASEAVWEVVVPTGLTPSAFASRTPCPSRSPWPWKP